MAQDVVLYQQLPTPDSLGLNPSSTVLEIWTEFLNPPQPAVTASPHTADQTLDFGQTRMARGFAYLLNSGGLQRVPLHKTWTNILNRSFLIESIPYPTLKPLLDTLQASAGQPPGTQTAKRLFPDRKTFVANAFQSKRKPIQTAAIRPGRANPQPAVLLDYQTVSTSQSTYTFAADTTYYVSALVNISGTATFEGGTVIKLAPGSSAGLCLGGSVVWGGSAYRPIVLTGKDDNSLGDPISGSSGNPAGNYYGACALELYDAVTPAYLRISYATEAIQFNDAIVCSLSHSQIGNCKYVFDNEVDWPITVTLENVLLYNDPNLSANATPISVYGEQVTLDNVNNSSGTSATLTNSLFAGTTGFSGGTANQYPASDSGVFQTVGAGAHYLAGNTYRGAGTANIASSTLAYLAQRTTYPPTLITTISANTTLSPNASVPRDVGPAPDLGYHYDPLDYCLDAVNLSYALTLTNGVALGTYGNYGLNLKSGAKIVSWGAPVALNHICRYQSVQELSYNWGNAGSTLSLINLSSSCSTLPQAFFRFTDFSFLGSSAPPKNLWVFSL